MKDLISITIRLTERDPAKLYSEQSYEKLENCVQAIEIARAISFALYNGSPVDHRVLVDEARMQVTLIYSAPDVTHSNLQEFGRTFVADLEKLYSSFQESKDILAEAGVEIVTEVTSIETIGIPG